MNNERERMLRQLRAALPGAQLPAARATIPAREIATSDDRAAMTASFQREVDALGGNCAIAAHEAAAIALLLQWLREANAQQVLTWDDAALPLRGLGQTLSENGYTRIFARVSRDAAERKTELAALERADAGITGALAGLADSGALALVSQPMQARLVSLLPPMHIALLAASRLYPTMAAFFASQPDVTRRGSNLVFIAGPSRTADIEMTLTRGVHGPKFLRVLLLEWL
ncbi:MAG: hypothetical protein BroJett039_02240 [Chloroflexota bacterium]|nr:MAG: hypothetical protein BroJett039_02240 [Chloroflexota bacterium]